MKTKGKEKRKKPNRDLCSRRSADECTQSRPVAEVDTDLNTSFPGPRLATDIQQKTLANHDPIVALKAASQTRRNDWSRTARALRMRL